MSDSEFEKWLNRWDDEDAHFEDDGTVREFKHGARAARDKILEMARTLEAGTWPENKMIYLSDLEELLK